ncbi:DUF5313 family protein [Prauserella alba]|uniref:DUF2628 domain-containing protein n=1 Tax=Prauserella alba TaxID=176898 RepID=A0ABN1VPY4_9PSEU|nr:DUF5313 family protein [Prauserella alba]MCP2179572.1 hypothetical protein [Prauserella alba]
MTANEENASEDRACEDQGGEDQGGEDQGGEDQGSEDQGSEDQGSEDQGSEGKVRPGPIHWLRYSVGGRLPDELAPWVLKDATSRAWRWRLAARNLVYLIPLASVWLLLPGPLGLRLSLSLMAMVVGVFYSQAYGDESVELRVAKHGFAYGQARAIRRERANAADAANREAYEAIYRS